MPGLLLITKVFIAIVNSLDVIASPHTLSFVRQIFVSYTTIIPAVFFSFTTNLGATKSE